MARTRDDLQVLVVYNADTCVPHGDPGDLIAVQATIDTSRHLHRALVASGYQAGMLAVDSTLDAFREELSRYPVQSTMVFFNCDGFAGKNSGSALVARLIEEMGFCHTGAKAEAIWNCIDKSRSKQRLVAAGVPTPKFQVFEQARGDFSLGFPVIVKPMDEDGSIGIDAGSVVTDEKALFERIASVVSAYEEPVLVEEYIIGREFAVSLWGNDPIEALPVAEDDFGDITDPLQMFLTYESKWVEGSRSYQQIRSVPAQLSPELERQVKEVGMAAFQAVGLRDFGRVDLRYRGAIPYVIDVNEIPDLAPGAGFFRTVSASGLTYEEMVARIVESALKREGWK
ncbi:MAG: ATP-grasp domain-containing protein [Chloroflexi bacterium]|nr:ATP-grasp domain-containing protein [Chloroflexota bacterium]